MQYTGTRHSLFGKTLPRVKTVCVFSINSKNLNTRTPSSKTSNTYSIRSKLITLEVQDA